MNTTRFVVERRPFDDAVRLYAKGTDSDGSFAYICRGVDVHRMKSGEFWPEFLTFPDMWGPTAQALFQALWDAGFRPNEGEATAAHVEAMRLHLKDMRSLVFKRRLP